MKTGLSVVVPVFNEEKIIEKNTETLLEFLKTFSEEFEVIIADNGSTDSTLERAKKLAKRFKKVKIVSVQKKGVGLAFKKAVSKASFENIVSIDMDLSIDLKFLPKAIQLLKKNQIVVGSKKIGNQKRPLLRKFLSNTYIFLAKKMLNLKFEDYSLAAKAYKKSFVLKNVNKLDNGTCYVIELIYLAKKKGLKIVEIPVHCHDTRKSKFNLVSESTHKFLNLLKLLGY